MSRKQPTSRNKGPSVKETVSSEDLRYESRSPASEVVRISSTEAQNGFGQVLDLASRDRAVLITRHDAPQAVVISVERYRELTRSSRPDLGRLTAEFDAMVAAIRAPAAKEAVREALRASPGELGRAAVAAARRRTR
jgi:prevent-host-death family protein